MLLPIPRLATSSFPTRPILAHLGTVPSVVAAASVKGPLERQALDAPHQHHIKLYELIIL